MLSILIGTFSVFLIILVHEAGHFIVAKLLGLPIVSFSVGFGKALWKRRIGDTVYALRIFPLGGSVRQVDHDGSEPDFREYKSRRSKTLSVLFPIEEEEVLLANKLASRPPPWSYRGYAWRTMLVILAGPIANILFAGIIAAAYGMKVGVGNKIVSPRVVEVISDSSAARAGLKIGDKIEAINQVPFTNHRWYLALIKSERTNPVTYKVTRLENNSAKTFDLIFGAEERRNSSGASYMEPGFRYPLPSPTAGELLTFTQTVLRRTIHDIFGQIPQLPSNLTKPDGMQGPIGMVTYITGSMKKGLRDFVVTIIIFNLFLTVLNLFPIPPMDGWAFLTTAGELVYGRKLAENFQRTLSRATMSFFLVLTLLLLAKDIVLLF